MRRKLIAGITAVAAVICIAAVYPQEVQIEAASARQEREEAQEQPEECVMFGDVYERTGQTQTGAAIYGTPSEYILAAIEDAGITDSMGDYGKVCRFSNYLGRKLSYAEYAKKEGYYEEDNTPFTDQCLITDMAVCSGYAAAFQSMCRALGIECWYVTGYVLEDGEYQFHAWDCVVLDGKEYYIDPLLNDNTGNAFNIPETLHEDYQIEAQYERFPFPE